MEEIALEWFSWMESSDMLHEWNEFAADLLQRFSDNEFSLAGGKLSKIYQLPTESVVEYQARYETQANKVVGIPDFMLYEMFISGLKDDIQKQVIRGKPVDIHEAMAMARLMDDQSPMETISNYPQKKYYKQTTTPKTNNTVTTNSASTPATTEKALLPNFKRLSYAERKERRSKGLCYNCDEKFVSGHVCKGRLFRLSAEDNCLWEAVNIMDDEDEEAVEIPEETTETTEISLHALRGQINSKTIRLGT